MSFESTYQLISPVADSADALSYRAVMKMTGEEVWIHLIRPESLAVFEMAKKQFATASFGEKPILEVAQEGARFYVVTRPLPPGAGLLDWLRTLGQAKTPDPLTQAGAFKFSGFAPPPPIRSSTPAALTTEEMPTFDIAPPAPVEELTRMMIPEPAPAPVHAPVPISPPVAPPVPMPAQVPLQVQAPGEFTRMFQTSQAAQAPAPPPVYAPPAPTQDSAPEPFFPPPPVAPVFAAAPPPPKKDDGEFTRMFQSPLMDHTPAPINPITHPIAPPPSQQAGEFTRMFKAISAPSVMPMQNVPSTGPAASGPGDFTRLLQTPSHGGSSSETSSVGPSSPLPFGGGTATPPPHQPGTFSVPASGQFNAPPPQFGAPAGQHNSPPSPFNAPAPQYNPPGGQFTPPPSQYNPQSAPPAQSNVGGQPPAPGGSGSSYGQVPINRPSFSAPSVSIQGISAPSISSSGQISTPRISAPSFHAGSMSGPSLFSGASFSLDNLPGFGPGSSGAAPDVAAPAVGPLSANAAPMNPNALSSGDGATSFFKVQQHAQPSAPQTPAQAGPGDYTRMMKAPPVASAPAVGVPIPKSNEPPTAPAPIFSQPVAPAASSIPAAVPPPVAPPAPKGFLKGISPWMIAGNVAVILMVVALLYVIFRSSR